MKLKPDLGQVFNYWELMPNNLSWLKPGLRLQKHTN